LDLYLLNLVEEILNEYKVKEIVFRNYYITYRYIHQDNNEDKWIIENRF